MKNLVGLLALSSTVAGSPGHYSHKHTSHQGAFGNSTRWSLSTHHGKACWRDIVNGVRALDHAATSFDASFATPRKCRDACRAEGFRLAAVEYGHECWCGNTLAGKPSPVDDEYCNFPCSGDESQMCGGNGFMNMWGLEDWHNSPHHHRPPHNWKVVSCYKDIDANRRQLPFQPQPDIGEPESARTVEGCVDACQSYGFNYMGLENGQECYCGSHPPPPILKGGECHMSCKGDAKQQCGGKHSLLVYARDGHDDYDDDDGNDNDDEDDDDDDDDDDDVDDDAHDHKAHQPLTTPVTTQTTLPRRRVARSDAGTDDGGLLPIPLPKLPKLPIPGLPDLPDLGDILKKIRPLVGHMFAKIQSDVALSKKSSEAVLGNIPSSSDGPALDAWLLEILESEELDAGNPIGDAIDRIKAILTGLFNKVKEDIDSTKRAALLLLDHLPGRSSVETIDAE